MGLFVTITAIRYGRMFGLVAESTVESSVFGLALGQHGKEFGMAGAAVFGLGVIGILDVERAVGLMAAQAILVDHEVAMGFVAFQAFFDLLMLGRMTEGTILSAVLAWKLGELLALFRVAGLARDADRWYVIDRDIKWGVRVTVATETIREFEMPLAVRGVAHGALRDGILTEGEVLKMAFLTGDFGLVLAAVALNVRRLAVVAFDAIGVL